MTVSKFHTQDPRILGVTAQNLVATATWRPGFVHPCCNLRIVRSRSAEIKPQFTVEEPAKHAIYCFTLGYVESVCLKMPVAGVTCS
jgi:hypothetical protein